MRSRGFRRAWIGFFLTVMFLLAVDSVRRESVTYDEPLHLTAGYTFWAFDDYRLQESHGALPQRWFALPLLFEKVKFPSRDDDAWHHPGYLGLPICRKFLFDSGNDANAMVFSGRMMAVLIMLATAMAVYGWTARMFGGMAGLLALFLCALDPTLLAHGPLMTSDVTSALFFLMSVGCLWNLLRRFTWLRLASSALCCGLLMVSKMSGGLVAPMALLMFLCRVALGRPWPVRLRGFRPRQIRALGGKLWLAAGTALAHVIVALAIIWSFYGWQYQPSSSWNADNDSYTQPRNAVFDALGREGPMFMAMERWKVVPDAYLYGLAHTVVNQARRPAYLNGEYRMTGWWYYFPYCFLVKTPLTLMVFTALGVAAIAWSIARWSGRRRAALLACLDRTSLVWSLLLVYCSAAVLTDLNIGHRHLLPIYLPLFMLAGAAGWWFMRGKRWTRAVIIALMVMQTVVIARIHPHYLAYFNELIGGPANGYRHLVDSNVDWGQDLPALSQWLRERQNLTNEGDVYLRYSGFDLPQRWGIQARTLPGLSNLRFSAAGPLMCGPGTYCISATALIFPGAGRPPWDEVYERRYEELLATYREMAVARPPRGDDPEGMQQWRTLLTRLADAQFDRLRGYLVGRKPDAMIGYSILIYQLSDKEINAALLP
jgi:4-amino-4-deoxy-L-arabinose transferase-like glycosyltransferase